MATASLSFAPASAEPGDGGGAPPNVLVLVADDLGTEVLSAYGAQPNQPPTPVLDQLALDGVTFQRAWAAPLCTPARGSLQTGRYALRHGMGGLLGGIKDVDLGSVGLPLTEVTLPELLDVGAPGVWQSACIGKWHLGSESVGGVLSPNDAGYGHFAGTLGNFQGGESFYDWERIVDGVAANETGYATTVQVDDALAWIGQAAEPWMCVVNFSAPHVPFHAPPAALHTQDLSGAGAPDQDTRPYFNAMVEAMDTEIGRLLAGLGAAEPNTLVVFVADNGTPASAAAPPLPSNQAKGSFFEGGVRVPLIVKGPHVTLPGSACDALVDITDIWPTVAEVAGIDGSTVVDPGVTIDGVSLVPFLADPTLPSVKSEVFTEHYRPNGQGNGLPVFFGTGPLCQEDLGFGGPGTTTLTACGDVLGGDGKVDLFVSGAPPNSPLFLAGSLFSTPVPAAGGTLVPFPETGVWAFWTDAQGEFLLPGFSASLGPFSYYFQVAIADPTQAFGYAISNAVRITVQPGNLKAVRGERYKLVRQYNSIGPESLYDLWSDPDEMNDLLLAPPLDPDAEAGYLALSAALDGFLASYNE